MRLRGARGLDVDAGLAFVGNSADVYVRLLKRFTDELLLVFDADRAGRAAAHAFRGGAGMAGVRERFGRRLRLGIIGGGPESWIGRMHRGAAEHDGWWHVVAGVFSSDAARSRSAGAAMGFDPARSYGDVSEMLAREKQRVDGIDAVAITTPNREYNVTWENVGAERLRHPDHRFEWTRHEFAQWAESMAVRFGYGLQLEPVGPVDDTHGAPSQMAVFSLSEPRPSGSGPPSPGLSSTRGSAE